VGADAFAGAPGARNRALSMPWLSAWDTPSGTMPICMVMPASADRVRNPCAMVVLAGLSLVASANWLNSVLADGDPVGHAELLADELVDGVQGVTGYRHVVSSA
jgi:hypothetical protein